jgi:AraC family transcriptional regulator of adaptative response/methylated-DNA-[protein]-cysteine methyltransferase
VNDAARHGSRFGARGAEARRAPSGDAAGVTTPTSARLHRAVEERDARFDGQFVYAVRTTGVFCRPGCGARTPRRENVRFFPDARAALAAGFRPCKRCAPLAPRGALPADVARLLAHVERADEHLSDADLAARGFDPSTVRRHFTAALGRTFHAHQRAARLGRAAEALARGADVLGAAAAAGYDSTSGFYDAVAEHFGTTPAHAAPRLFAQFVETPIGAMVVVACDAGLCLVEFTDRAELPRELADLRARHGSPIAQVPHDHTRAAAAQLTAYFERRRAAFDVPLAPHGTPFQRAVWQSLLAIPAGTTIGYAEQARRLGRPTAVRAVAGANGANRLAIVVPCHRVVGSDGRLTGYAGGVWRKRWLLDHERAFAQP